MPKDAASVSVWTGNGGGVIEAPHQNLKDLNTRKFEEAGRVYDRSKFKEVLKGMEPLVSRCSWGRCK